MMRIFIVDDEPLARARLEAQIQDKVLGEIVGQASNGIDAIRFIESNPPDVVLLDIRMPGMDGIETAQHLMRLPSPPAIIFTTAYDEHALAAFEANAIDYLLKPIRSARLEQALGKARVLSVAQTNEAASVTRDASRTHISGTAQGDLSLVPIERVRYFQADQGYVDVVWDEGSVLIEEPLRALEDEFKESFVRVHRNALVAVQYISGLTRDTSGNYLVNVADVDAQLPVSRRLLSSVRARLR